MFGQSGSRSKLRSRKFVTNRDTTVDPVGLMPFLTDAFLLCIGPDVVDGVVAELAADTGLSMGWQSRPASDNVERVYACDGEGVSLPFPAEPFGVGMQHQRGSTMQEW